MDFVKSLEIDGIEAKEIPHIPGIGAPTVETVGAVGCLYMDTLTGHTYKCVLVDGDGYHWEPSADTEKIDEELSLRSQGRSAKYKITTPGWKRILNVIRASNGTLHLGLAKVVNGTSGISSQALGINFTGNVHKMIDNSTPVPVLYQIYNHEMGHNNDPSVPQKHARIDGVRIAYPVKGASYPNKPEGDTLNYQVNTINCYVDVHISFTDVSETGETVDLNMNYAGFADSHNCEAIIEETDATDTGKIYGEQLQYFEFTPTKDFTMYMPNDRFYAKEVKSENIFTKEEIIKSCYPPFTLTGSHITCYPLPGSNVAVSCPDCPIEAYYVCGKNMYDFSNGDNINRQNIVAFNGATIKRVGYSVHLPPGTYTIHASIRETPSRATSIRCIINSSNGEYKGPTSNYIVQDSIPSSPITVTLNKGDILYVYHNDEVGSGYITMSLDMRRFNIQIEQGSVATPFEPYNEYVSLCDDVSSDVHGDYEHSDFIAREGVNHIYTISDFELVVRGITDPVHKIAQLEEVILSLGGNI